MRRASKYFVMALLVMITAATSPGFGDEPKKDAGELSLPWGEFQKLFKLDKDEITLTWEEFQALLKQTGATETPPFQLQNGNVVLTRAEFKRLLDQMKSPPSEASKYYLTKALYTGTVGSQSTLIKAQVRLHVLHKEERIQPLRVPLFQGAMAFQEVLVDGQPALIENDGSQLYVILTKSGEHMVTASFSTPSSLKKPPYQLYFQVPRTPITQVQLVIPIRNLDIQVANASETQLSQVDNGTQVRATLPSQDSITVTWNPVNTEEAKGPAKVYADVYNLLTIEEDALRTKTLIDLDVLQNTVNSINVRVPNGYTILDVQGDAIGEWKMQGEDQKVLIVPFTYARRGKFAVTVTAEILLKEKSGVAEFEGFEVLKAVREKGFVGVELKTTAEAKTVDIKGLDRVDAQELPPPLLNMSARPLLFGFKYLRQPYAMNLDIQRHQEVAVVSTVVDEANGVTLVLEDGKRVHHMTFSVRNTWKQFLELNLPKDAQIWTVFVEGQRVRPSKNEQGKVFIPLNRSRAVNNDLNAFDVELMYYEGTNDLGLLGREKLQFPVPDVVVSQMLWSVYLPTKYDYLYFGGSVDKEESAQGLRPLMSVVSAKSNVLRDLEQLSETVSTEGYSRSMDSNMKRERADKAKSSRIWNQRGSFSAAQGVDEDSYAKQVEREINFFSQVRNQAMNASGQGDAGVAAIPIRVAVPNSGRVFRFTKKIIVDQSFLSLSVIYLHHAVVQILLLLVLVGVGTLVVKRRAQFMHMGDRVRGFMDQHENTLRWLRSPIGLMVMCFALMILLSLFSRFLSVLALLGFFGSGVTFLWGKLKAHRGVQ